MNSSVNYTLKSKQQGFTLIEVLVASFILFLVISAVTMVYRGALLSSFKAERTLQFAALVEPISEQIRIEIHAEKIIEQAQGQGEMGKLTYSWVAMSAYQSKAPEQFNAGTGELDTGDKTFKLWDITLQVQLKSATRTYQFSELSW
jgi:prepilin-type N-terminal cleavage/methylation domain-containing protein